jgi:hypothetical protein
MSRMSLMDSDKIRTSKSFTFPLIADAEVSFAGGAPSALDPAGLGSGYFVRCTKHKSNWYRIMIDLSMVFDLKEAALFALQQCPGCRQDQENEKTRFPEGAEL